jgi:hypothetical protein
LLKNKDSIWIVSSLNYYLNFDNAKTKVDSISTKREIKKIISVNEFNFLRTEQIWLLPSQSEMINGDSYGCTDGYSLLVELSNKSKYKFLSYVCPDFHISKDTTFQNIVNFKQKVAELIKINN